MGSSFTNYSSEMPPPSDPEQHFQSLMNYSDGTSGFNGYENNSFDDFNNNNSFEGFSEGYTVNPADIFNSGNVFADNTFGQQQPQQPQGITTPPTAAVPFQPQQQMWLAPPIPFMANPHTQQQQNVMATPPAPAVAVATPYAPQQTTVTSSAPVTVTPTRKTKKPKSKKKVAVDHGSQMASMSNNSFGLGIMAPGQAQQLPQGYQHSSNPAHAHQLQAGGGAQQHFTSVGANNSFTPPQVVQQQQQQQGNGFSQQQQQQGNGFVAPHQLSNTSFGTAVQQHSSPQQQGHFHTAPPQAQQGAASSPPVEDDIYTIAARAKQAALNGTPLLETEADEMPDVEIPRLAEYITYTKHFLATGSPKMIAEYIGSNPDIQVAMIKSHSDAEKARQYFDTQSQADIDFFLSSSPEMKANILANTVLFDDVQANHKRKRADSVMGPSKRPENLFVATNSTVPVTEDGVLLTPCTEHFMNRLGDSEIELVAGFESEQPQDDGRLRWEAANAKREQDALAAAAAETARIQQQQDDAFAAQEAEAAERRQFNDFAGLEFELGEDAEPAFEDDVEPADDVQQDEEDLGAALAMELANDDQAFEEPFVAEQDTSMPASEISIPGVQEDAEDDLSDVDSLFGEDTSQKPKETDDDDLDSLFGDNDAEEPMVEKPAVVAAPEKSKLSLPTMTLSLPKKALALPEKPVHHTANVKAPPALVVQTSFQQYPAAAVPQQTVPPIDFSSNGFDQSNRFTTGFDQQNPGNNFQDSNQADDLYEFDFSGLDTPVPSVPQISFEEQLRRDLQEFNEDCGPATPVVAKKPARQSKKKVVVAPLPQAQAPVQQQPTQGGWVQAPAQQMGSQQQQQQFPVPQQQNQAVQQQQPQPQQYLTIQEYDAAHKANFIKEALRKMPAHLEAVANNPMAPGHAAVRQHLQQQQTPPPLQAIHPAVSQIASQMSPPHNADRPLCALFLASNGTACPYGTNCRDRHYYSSANITQAVAAQTEYMIRNNISEEQILQQEPSRGFKRGARFDCRNCGKEKPVTTKNDGVRCTPCYKRWLAGENQGE